MGPFSSGGSWEEENYDDDRVSFDIPAAGVYRVVVWMREWVWV